MVVAAPAESKYLFEVTLYIAYVVEVGLLSLVPSVTAMVLVVAEPRVGVVVMARVYKAVLAVEVAFTFPPFLETVWNV